MASNRLYYIDVIKVLAIVFVVMYHLPITWQITTWDENLPMAWNANMVIAIMGVPLFLMSTGALLLDRDLSSYRKIKLFLKKNFLPIFFTGAIWNVVYYFVNTKNIAIADIVKSVLLINKQEEHLWYIRMILLYYALMPIMSGLLRYHKRFFILLVAICFLISFGNSGYLIFFRHEVFPTISGVSFSCYLVYMYAGYCVAKSKFKIHPIIPFFICLISLSLMCFLREIDWFRFYWYDNPLCLIASISAFALIKNVHLNENNAKQIAELSKMTFGVYLCHMLFVKCLFPSIALIYDVPFVLSYYSVLVLTLLLSLMSILIVKKYTDLSYILFRY